MALYARSLPKCQCGKPASYSIERSGTDPRAVACVRCVNKIGRELASRIGEEWFGS
jgi:hypothetical protein